MDKKKKILFGIWIVVASLVIFSSSLNPYNFLALALMGGFVGFLIGIIK